MDVFAAQRQQFDRWVSDAEALQHDLAVQRLELDQRKRDLDNLETVVRKREREISDSQTKVHLEKQAKIRTRSSAVSVLDTNPKIAAYLKDHEVTVVVIPDEKYDDFTVSQIQLSGLRVTMTVGPLSEEPATLYFLVAGENKAHRCSIRVAREPQHPFTDHGHVTMILKPCDNEWTSFKVDSFSIRFEYPMSKINHQ